MNKLKISEHDKLVEMGRKWLSSRSPVVITELVSSSEEPDVFGLQANIHRIVDGYGEQRYGSCLIECKASRADYKSDSKKSFRMYPWQGIGSLRFYLAPEGLLDPDELPENWGLLEAFGKRVKIVKMPENFKEFNIRAEMNIMVSCIRRLNIPKGNHYSLKVNKRETKNKASLTTNDNPGIYSMNDILAALEVSGIRLVSTRKKFFDALLPEDEKLTEEEQLERVNTMGY